MRSVEVRQWWQALTEEEEWRICTPGGEQQERAMACGLALGRPKQHSGGLTNRGLGQACIPTRLFFHMAVLRVCFVENTLNKALESFALGAYCGS